MIKVFYICSYGGSATKMLGSWLESYGHVYTLHDPNPPDILTYGTILSNGLCYDDRRKVIAMERIKDPLLPEWPNHIFSSWSKNEEDELDLNKYKPYVIFIYSRPECSVWSMCDPYHWLNLHMSKVKVAKLCFLMGIPIKLFKIEHIIYPEEDKPWITDCNPIWVNNNPAMIASDIEIVNTYSDYEGAIEGGVGQFFQSSFINPSGEKTPVDSMSFDQAKKELETEPSLGFVFEEPAQNVEKRFSKKYLEAMPVDYINYERFFRNYYTEHKNYDVLCVNYHDLWDNLTSLFNFCEIPLKDIDKFPKQRTPSWEKDPQITLELEKAHNGIFKSLNNLIKQRPSIGNIS